MSRLLARVIGGLRALFQRTRTEHDLDEELRAYLEAAVEQHAAAGMSREDALRAARVEMGSVEATKDHVRDVGWEAWVESLWQDVRYAFRSFRRTPAFTAAAIATLALDIGGTTAIFSVVDGLFLRAPDGVDQPASLRKVFIRRDSGRAQTPAGGPGSWSDYVTLREDVRAFDGVGAYLPPSLGDLGRGSQAAQVRIGVVSHDFLQVLGVRPAIGRLFLAEEDGARGASPVAVLGYRTWQTRFGGAPDVIGSTIHVNGEQLEIVGVTAKGFSGIGSDVVDVWLPSSVGGTGSDNGRDWRDTTAIGVLYVARLAPGATDAAATDQGAAALRHAAEAAPSLDQTPDIMTTSLALAARPYGTPQEGKLSLWLALVAGLVLLIACANVANLLLARAITRRRELSVRLSLGAGTWRVARQHLTESTLLALLGGTAGVLLAYLGMGLMRQFPLPPSAGRIDGRLLGFALAVSVITGMLFGLLPALRAARVDPLDGLKDARAPRSHSSPARARRALVVLQVTLSLALLVGAGLFVRSLRQVSAIDAGVAIDRLLVASVDLKTAGYPAADRAQFYDSALSRLSKLPGVERAAIVHAQPFGQWYQGSVVWRMAGRPGPDGTPVRMASLNLVGPGYFTTAGTRLLRGREIQTMDHGGEPVAVVNDALARQMADAGNVVGLCVPLGRQLKLGGCTRILGVVETQHRFYLLAETEPTVFRAWAEAPDAIPFGVPALIIRTRGEPTEYAAAVQSALQGLRADLPYVSVYPLTDNVADAILPFRLGATLFSLFGVLALLLSGLGLYGVLGYFVNERTPEIGIRRSLGAPARTVVGLVIRQGMMPVAFGVLLGLAVAFGGSRYLASLLFGVDARDAASFVVAVLFLVGVATLATLLPALRAARVDPMTALRSE